MVPSKTLFSTLAFLLLFPVLYISCSEESVDQNAIPASVVRESSKGDFDIVYNGKQIVAVDYYNLGFTDAWEYTDSKLTKINFRLSNRENFEQNYTLEYDDSGRLNQFFYLEVDRSQYAFSRIELRYEDGLITKDIYRDQSTVFGPQDGVLEFVGTQKLFLENGNVVKVETADGDVFHYTYGTGKSPFSNLEDFEILQILFTTQHFNNTVINATPELYLGRNNLESSRSDRFIAEENYATTFGGHGLPKEIVSVNQDGLVQDVVTISYTN